MLEYHKKVSFEMFALTSESMHCLNLSRPLNQKLGVNSNLKEHLTQITLLPWNIVVSCSNSKINIGMCTNDQSV